MNRLVLEADEEATKIRSEMIEAFNKDKEAILAKRPAINKLLVARNLYNNLKKREI